MKVYGVVTSTTEALALAALDTIEVQFGREWYRLESFANLFEQILMAKLAGFAFGVWLEVPLIIQGMRATIDGVLTTISLDYLDSEEIEAYEDITKDTTVKEWKKDVVYLIPYTAGAVLNMIPPSQITPIEGTSDGVFIPTHFAYFSTKQESIRGGVSFTSGAEMKLSGKGAGQWSTKKSDSSINLGVSVIKQMGGIK